MIGLYVHIPFCTSICNYCNFNRGLYDEALKTRYVEALRREIATAPEGLQANPASAEATAGPPGPCPKRGTIFFGAGRPPGPGTEKKSRTVPSRRRPFPPTTRADDTLST